MTTSKASRPTDSPARRRASGHPLEGLGVEENRARGVQLNQPASGSEAYSSL